METSVKPHLVDTTPRPRVYSEKIGSTLWELPEIQLNVFDDVALWNENPRLMPYLPGNDFAGEEELEASLQRTPGYDNLKKSIEKMGQIEPIYVWRADDQSPYIVYEGATRVTILRDLSRKYSSGPSAGRFIRVKAKVLPPHFGETDRVILLARIHVRGTGIRSWGRYIESKFIHEHVTGRTAVMSVSEMADHMEKSVSWVQRLRDAYEFAQRFVHFLDGDPAAERTALERFSTLEEISKAPVIGSLLRNDQSPAGDVLREEVFGMVRNEVFKEYRDARFLKQFHDDHEKWALLKTGEKHIASRLAAELKSNEGGIKAKIAGLEASVERALQRGENDLNEDDITHLRSAIARIQQQAHIGIDPFRLDLKNAAAALAGATMASVKALPHTELDEFREALGYFDMLVQKYGPTA